MNYIKVYNNELYHHGILGQKWGVRRFQNADGSYTEAGRKRYGATDSNHEKRNNRNKKLIRNVSIVIGAGLAIYGGVKISNYISQTKSANKAVLEAKRYIESIKNDPIFNSKVDDNLFKEFGLTLNPGIDTGVNDFNKDIFNALNEIKEFNNGNSNNKLFDNVDEYTNYLIDKMKN